VRYFHCPQVPLVVECPIPQVPVYVVGQYKSSLQRDKTNIVRGHRAAISNPSMFVLALPSKVHCKFWRRTDVSDEAKKHLEQVIKELGDENYGQSVNENKDEKNVARCYKALHSLCTFCQISTQTPADCKVETERSATRESRRKLSNILKKSWKR
jgi:hypothetical protein